MRLGDVVDDLRAWLELARDEGLTELAVAPATLAAFAAVNQPVAGRARAKTAAASPARPAPRPAPVAATSPARPAPETAPRPAPAPHAGPPVVPAVVARDDTLPDIAGDSLEAVASEVATCTACDLCRARTRTVPGQGHPRPDILFVGEAPGHDEDQQGLAFVGRAGQLLTRMIEAMGYTRETVFIANINKCRPPDNRAPTPHEMATCMPFLKRQIALLNPKVIVALGNTALNGLIDVPKGMGITKLRGQWLQLAGIDLMPTFHPAYLLRNATQKRPAWEDLKAVLHRLGRQVPPVSEKR